LLAGGIPFAFQRLPVTCDQTMRCYIWGTNNCENRAEAGKGAACFVIPDWGLQFRAAHEGSAIVCELSAMLALLRFVESNPKVFEGQRLEILTDAAQLVEQLNGRAPLDPSQLRLFTSIRSLREKIRFEISWVPPDQNRAIDGVLDLPPLKTRFEIQHAAIPKRPHDVPTRRFNS
jgi:hypothetical protein